MDLLDERKVTRFFDDEDTKDRLEEFLTNNDSYPTNVVIHPTMICNHRCDFCNYFYNIDEQKKLLGGNIPVIGFIHTDDMLRFLKEFDECGVKTLIFSGGGEPLLHKDIRRILEESFKYNFKRHIYTNLDFNLDNFICELLAKLDSINININTIDADLYKSTRGGNTNFNRVLHNVDKLKNLNANLNSIIIVRDNTIHALEKTLSWMDNYDFSNITVSPAFDLDYQDGITTKKTIDNLKKVKELISGNKKIKILKEVEEAVFNDRTVYCRTHFFDITIGADYGIYPCCMTSYMKDYELVNLRKFGSFVEAWKSEERKSKINDLKFGCTSCWFGSTNHYLRSIGVK